MTLLAPPGRQLTHTAEPLLPRECEEPEALIEEARQRARKRRRRYAAALATGVLLGAGLYVGFGGHTGSHHRPRPRPRAVAGVAHARVCRTSQLKITTIHSGGRLGTSGAYIAFTNASRTSCELTGWPELIAITATGHVSAARHYPASSFTVTTTGIGVPVVKLSPGKRADAAFSAADNPGPGETTCPPNYRWLRVTPPGNTKSVILSAWVRYLGGYLPACRGGVGLSPALPKSDLMGG